MKPTANCISGAMLCYATSYYGRRQDIIWAAGSAECQRAVIQLPIRPMDRRSMQTDRQAGRHDSRQPYWHLRFNSGCHVLAATFWANFSNVINICYQCGQRTVFMYVCVCVCISWLLFYCYAIRFVHCFFFYFSRKENFCLFFLQRISTYFVIIITTGEMFSSSSFFLYVESIGLLQYKFFVCASCI